MADSSLNLHEKGGTFTQTVWLGSQPTVDVTVTLDVVDATVATVSPSILTFTPQDWDMPQPVMVATIDDAVYNRQHRATTVTVTAAGGNYNGVTRTFRVVAVNDDPGSLTLPEGRTVTGQLPLVLEQGIGTVVVTLSSSNTDVLTVTPPTMSWTEAESGTSRPFTLTTVENAFVGDRQALLSFTPSANYKLPLNGFLVTVVDNDEGALVVRPTSLTVRPGGQSTYTVALAAEPSDAVTVAISGHAGTDLTLDPSAASLTFETSNWAIPQAVTVSAGEDAAQDTVTLTHTASGGDYDSVTADLEVTVTDRDGSDSARLPDGLPSVQIWTERLGLSVDEQVRLFWDINPRGDEREYAVFLYLESIDSGVRRYLVPRSGELREAVVDQYGAGAEVRRARKLERVERDLAWEGRVPHAGLWHFVLEVRSPGTAQVLRSAFAKFVVPRNGFRVLNRTGTVRHLTEDTRWSSDWVYSLQDRLLVRSGVTLTIEAGTLINAWGPSAAIVVEPGGRIVVRGRREAPVVMTCSLPVGTRFPGCWGGLAVNGDGTRHGGPARERGSPQQGGPAPGSGNGHGSASELRFLRVEFAGARLSEGERAAALALVGVGSRTVAHYVQVHASAGDGFAFRGGGGHCGHCVASEVRQSSVSWSKGWKGSAQHLYVQQGSHGASGIRGSAVRADSLVAPKLYNVTLVGGYNASVLGGTPGKRSTIGPGIRLEGEAAVTVRNLLITGFAGFAIVGPANSFEAGASSLASMMLYSNYLGRRQVPTRLEPWVDYVWRDPDLLNIRFEANPDPRPRSGSPALRLGNAMVPPFDRRFSRDGHFVGAFGSRNWLAEWTFFGPERFYEVPID